MPKQPRMNAAEAEALLFRAGFEHIRSKGSHRIYMIDATRVVLPYHAARDLHPKIVRQVPAAIEETDR